MLSIASVKLLKEGEKISAANGSQICPGASAMLVLSERALKDQRLTPLARIVNLIVTAGDPVIMLEEVIPVTRSGAGAFGSAHRQDRPCEVNEAFAPVPMALDVRNRGRSGAPQRQSRRDRPRPSARRLPAPS
jgi:acetyl-CoA C-acetyltransferase